MSFINSTLSASFKLANQLSPIILTDGLATFVGGYLPIIAITEGFGLGEIASFVSTGKAPDQYFANFRPTSGTLIRNEVAQFPFFTQQIAANAQIQQPLDVSLLMYCPAKRDTSYAAKLAIMSSLKSLLDVHTSLGGTYSVVTPSWIYTNCLLTNLSDVSTEETNQVQWAYQWDFVQPLLTFPGFNSIESAAMSMMSGATFPATNGALSWSGPLQAAFPNISKLGNFF